MSFRIRENFWNENLAKSGGYGRYQNGILRLYLKFGVLRSNKAVRMILQKEYPVKFF